MLRESKHLYLCHAEGIEASPE